MSTAKLIKDCGSYLSLLEQSGLLTGDELSGARTAGDQASDAKSLARELVKRQLLTSWQAAQLLGGWTGLVIGKYKLCRQLGKSDVGRVYLAQHAQMARQVALKTLSRRFTSDPEVVERFLADARAAATLDHRNIVHVYDVNSADDRFYLAMEYVDGRDLQGLVEEHGPLSPADAATCIRQAAEGLEHAHQREICHGDLHPTNIMRDQAGVIKLLGLGLGRLIAAPEGVAESGNGHAAWLPPEQRELPGPPSIASDLYALGASFYYLLTGRLPTLEHGARDLLKRRPELPEDLARICARAMARDPAKRFSSSAQLKQALDRWLEENPVAEEEERLQEVTPLEPVEELDAQPEAGELFTWSPGKPAAETETPRLRRAKPLAAAENAAPADQSGSTGAKPAAGKSAPASKPSKSATEAPAGPKQAGSPPKTPKPKSASARPALPLGLLIGGGAGAVLLVGLLSVLAYVLFGGFGSSQVAQSDTPAAADSQEPGVDPLESGDPLEAGDPLESGDPLEPVGARATAPATAATQPAANDLAAAQPGPAATAPANPVQPAPPGTEAVPAEPAGAEPPVPAAPAGTAATPAAEPGPPAEPAPAQPAATPPAEPPPQQPAPKPQPAVKPFEGFAKAVALPPLPESGAGEPQALGPVRLPEKLICFIRLKGGANACKGPPEIQFRNANNGTSETEFEAFLAGSKTSGDSLKIADLALRDGQLFFQWTAEAASDPNAITLSNCALTMNVGAEMHEFALRVADVVQASELNLSKPETLKIQVANLPDPLGVRVQLLKTGGTLPPHLVEPDVPVPADNGEMKIKFGQTPEEQVLELDVDFDIRRDVQASVTPYFRWPLDEKPVKLTKATVTQATQSAATNRLQLANLLNQMRQAEKSVPAAQKALFGVELTKVEQQLAKVEAGVQSADRLRALLEAAGENCQLHFRVFYDADGFEVDLARTE